MNMDYRDVTPQTLYHYRFRTYIPEWGSFTGPDMNLALGIRGEFNGMGNYLFCNNNPLVWVDPFGLAFGDWWDPRTHWFIAGGFAEGLGGGASVTVNTFTFGAADWIGLTDSDQYQGGAYNVSRVSSTVAREALITAGTMGIGTAARGGSAAAQVAHKTILVTQAGTGGYQVGTGVNKIREGDTLAGSLDILGGGLRVGGSLLGAREVSKWAGAADDSFESVMKRVDDLDFSTPRNKAVFYSGKGQGDRALAFVEKTDGVTIEMTKGGRALAADPAFRSLSRSQQDLIWQRASVPFAKGASGRINAFIRGADPSRTFRSIEEPILKKSSDVFRYIYHY